MESIFKYSGYHSPTITVAVHYKIKNKLTKEQMGDLGWYLEHLLERYPDVDLYVCAEKWLAGKRAKTLPGTKQAKKNKKKTQKSLVTDKENILQALATINPTLVEQYLSGKDKVINAIVGQVISITRANPAAVREIVIMTLKNESPCN